MNMVAGEKGKNPSHSELLKEIHPFNYHQKRFDSLWQQEGGRVVASYVSYNYHSDHRIRYSSSTINKETIQMRKRSKST
jgi:hypothetical protein